MAVRGHFASQGTVAGSKNGYGAQQIELGFLVGSAPDAEPLQHILLLAALQVAQLEQACTDGVGGAVILLRLLDGPGPAPIGRAAGPLAGTVVLQGLRVFLRCSAVITPPPFFGTSGVPGPKKQASRCSMVSPSMAERRSASLTLKSLSSFSF